MRERDIQNSQSGGDPGKSGGDFRASLAEQIAASGLMTSDCARRTLHKIFTGDYRDRKKRHHRQEVVSLETADKILTALDLNHVWHTELADHIVEARCTQCGFAHEDTNPDCERCRRRAYARRANAKFKASKRGPARDSRLSERSSPPSSKGGATKTKETA